MSALRKASSAAIAVLVTSMSTFACASAGGSGAARASDPGGAYPSEEAPMAASVAVSETSSMAGGPGGAEALFDFASDVIEGAFVKNADAPAAPPVVNNEPAAPAVEGPGDKPPVESSAAKRLVIYKGSLVVLVPIVEAAVEKLAAQRGAGRLRGEPKRQQRGEQRHRDPARTRAAVPRAGQ